MPVSLTFQFFSCGKSAKNVSACVRLDDVMIKREFQI